MATRLFPGPTLSPGVGNGAEGSAGKRKAALAAQPVAGAADGRARNGAPGADCEPLVPRGSRARSPRAAAGGAAVAGGFPLAVLERRVCALWWDGCRGSEIKF